jgi:UDP-N-acetylmuramate--alanine ligase
MPAADRLDLSRPLSVHVVGLGGAGMSAIAEVLATMGHRVSGSDLRPSPGLDRLRAAGVTVFVGHDASHVGPVDVVTISTAVPGDNPEVVAARARGVPVLARAEMLAAVTRLRRTVAVAGTHGKTTTSALTAVALEAAGLDPSYVVGGELAGRGTGARWSDGPWLVVEADESDGTFLDLATEVAVVTSVEPDHLEHYGDFDGLVAAFDRFLAGAAGPRVVCADDPVAARLAAGHGALTYGFDPAASLRIVGFEPDRSAGRFTLQRDGVDLGPVAVPMPGRHNARNAAGALAVALVAGADFDAAAAGIAAFAGVGRRSQLRGVRDGVTFVDDYAHLPGEVAPTLAAAAEGGWARVVCVFQPHRYSRTEALWADFADAFTDADVLVVTELYPAGEAPRPGVTGKLVADAVRAAHPSAPVEWVPERAGVVAYLRGELRPGDLCLTLGAGDLTTLADELLAT